MIHWPLSDRRRLTAAFAKVIIAALLIAAIVAVSCGEARAALVAEEVDAREQVPLIVARHWVGL